MQRKEGAEEEEPKSQQPAASSSRLTACYNNRLPRSRLLPNTKYSRTAFHASLVTTFYSHATRGPGRRRGCQPQISCPLRVYTATGRRHLFLPVYGTAVNIEDHRCDPRGDEQDWTGVFAAGAQSARIVGAERALAGNGREHVSSQRSQRR